MPGVQASIKPESAGIPLMETGGGGAATVAVGSSPQLAGAAGWRLQLSDLHLLPEPGAGADHGAGTGELGASPTPEVAGRLHPDVRLAVGFGKLLLVSALLLVLTRTVVVVADLEYDHEYGLVEFLTYDVNEVALDLLAFFVLGRLHRRPGVDTPLFVGLAAFNAVLMSLLNQLPALQVSFGLYEMHCVWSSWTWLAVVITAATIVGVVVLHVKFLATDRPLCLRCAVQFAAIVTLFWLPHVLSSAGGFHIHHWFYCWSLACVANLDPWWSQATQAYFFGGYINGIAVYGRDPLLVCIAAFYRAANGRCFFVSEACHCQDGNTTLAMQSSLTTVDWWACTGDYH